MDASKLRKHLGSGSKTRTVDVAKGLKKPKKRPTQERAKFTVDAIYEAYVRIWREQGEGAVTTRVVAEQAGFAVGTLYEYFPNIHALHSGYTRHMIGQLLARVEAEAIAPKDLPWRERLRRLIEITCGVWPNAPYFDAQMLALASVVAEPKHHQRAFEDYCGIWGRVFAACGDLRAPPGEKKIEALVLMVWGGRRYHLMLSANEKPDLRWVEQAIAICAAGLE